jgi:protoheme IX farnesyltransferase
LIGSLSGAMPPVIGYCVVSGQFDTAAFLLLLIFSLWQMPHSYAIAIVYRDDYANAGIPVLPVKHGIAVARKHILFYIPVFTAAALMLSVEGYVGRVYFAVITLLGLGWLGMGSFGERAASDKKWATRMFVFSIIGVMVLSLMMAIDYR